MRVSEGLAGLRQPWPQLFDVNDPLRPLNLQARERLAIDVLHRDRGRLAVLHEIVNADDVGVSQVEAPARLALHLILCLGIKAHFVRQEFQRDVPVQPFVMGQPDDPHAAPPQNAQELIAIEYLLRDLQAPDGRFKLEIGWDGRKLGRHTISLGQPEGQTPLPIRILPDSTSCALK